MSSAAISAPITPVEQRPYNQKHALAAANAACEVALRYDMREGGFPITAHPISWRKLNQRQLRKNRRRAHASGKRNSFA